MQREARLRLGPFVPESKSESERTDKNKEDFIVVTCRYRSRAGVSKKYNYAIKAKYFEIRPTEDFLHW